ncbi:MAG: hypothetical protein KatS3mg040_0035 [Candidatus Kapaibacterium sp.]|nr:MAG: hypothetical protein KatS3mg040_0035 [Candidatus Kapabacteria bacterium]
MGNLMRGSANATDTRMPVLAEQHGRGSQEFHRQYRRMHRALVQAVDPRRAVRCLPVASVSCTPIVTVGSGNAAPGCWAKASMPTSTSIASTPSRTRRPCLMFGYACPIISCFCRNHRAMCAPIVRTALCREGRTLPSNREPGARDERACTFGAGVCTERRFRYCTWSSCLEVPARWSVISCSRLHWLV